MKIEFIYELNQIIQEFSLIIYNSTNNKEKIFNKGKTYN